MDTMLLVHGAWHGPWCFDRVVPELQRRGWESRTVELPIEDPSAGATQYAEAIAAAGADLDVAPVVVGHSLAGLALPMVPARLPVQRLIYLAALIPVPGRSWVERIALEQPYGKGMLDHWDDRISDGPFTRWQPGPAKAIFYHDASESDARTAIMHLRPQAMTPLGEASPVRATDLEAGPSTYIACADDRTISPRWGARMARAQLTDAVVEFPGGHSPFWTRPAALADTLVDIASG